MTLYKAFVKRINRLVEVVVVIQFIILVAIVTAAVFARYVLNDSIVWAEECSRYLFIWVTFLGGGLGVGSNVHVGVDSFVALMPEKPKLVVQIFAELMIVVFTVVLIWAGIQFTALGMRSEALLMPISMGWIYIAVPVGGSVMLLNVLVALFDHLALTRRAAH